MLESRKSRGTRPATAHEVARRAGVSQSTVSRAFTPGFSVAPETRKRILDAAKAVGYRPNLIARSLIMNRSHILGVAISTAQNCSNPHVLELISHELQKVGYHVLLFVTEPSEIDGLTLETILQFRVDGLLLGSTGLSSTIANECAAASVPVVLFNRSSPSSTVSSVTVDNIRGAEAVAQFLAAGGHKRFAYIGGIEESPTSQERELGFSKWLTSNGFGSPYTVTGNYTFEQSLAAAREICKRKPRPDAIFCGSQQSALATMEVVRSEFGLRIPKDISVVAFGFDGNVASWPSFSLTSYCQPLEAMVVETIRLLMNSIEQRSGVPRKVMLTGELIVRDSARKPTSGIVQRGDKWLWEPSEL